MRPSRANSANCEERRDMTLDRIIAQQRLDRRRLLFESSRGLGVAALASLLPGSARGAAAESGLHFPARAKNVIYIFLSGGPSQMDLFDPKPKLREMNGQEIPKSVVGNQRLTTMTRSQSEFPLAGS